MLPCSCLPGYDYDHDHDHVGRHHPGQQRAHGPLDGPKMRATATPHTGPAALSTALLAMTCDEI